MEIKKVMMTAMTGTMMLSLAACGNKSTSTTKKDAVESSSHMKKSSHSNKKNTSKDSSVSTKQKSSSNESVALRSSSSSANVANSSNKVTAKSANNQAQAMTETDARNLVKEHLGNQRANALESGQSTVNQPTADAIDGFTATQNGTNDWTVSGTYGGRTYTYHVTPNAITGA
jgi:hypothetical protein